MIAEIVSVNFVNNIPLGISIYSVTREPVHLHNDVIEIIYCLKGEIILSVTHEQLLFKGGDIYVINATDLHSIESKCDVDNLIVSFYINALDKRLPTEDLIYEFFVCQEKVISKLTEVHIPDLKQLLLSALYYYCFHPDFNMEIYTRISFLTVDLMIKYFPLFYFGKDPPHFQPSDRSRFDSILRYIRKNYKKKITVTELAHIVHINPNYLSQFLKKTSNTGNAIGLTGIISFVRSYEAETLLMTTNMNIMDIGYACGFSDPKYFYRCFKQWYGRTPMQHRKWYEVYMDSARPNIYYRPEEKLNEIEHYIAHYLSEIILG